MALLDLITNPSNLSTIIEFIGLVGTIYLFFRKANEDNIKQVASVKENLEKTEQRICQRVTEVKLEVDKVRDNLFAHIVSGRERPVPQYRSNPISNIENEVKRNGNNNH